MSSSQRDIFRKSIGLRLALWFSVFFVLGNVVLFGLSYFLLSDSLRRRDRDSLEVRLQQLAAQYQSSDLAGLKKALSLEARLRRSKPFFVRIAGPNNALVFMELPDEWSDFNLEQIAHAEVAAPGSLTRVSSQDGDEVLEIAAARLHDGTILQVGKTTEERSEFLQLFISAVAVAAIPVVGFGVLGQALLGIRALRPIRELIRTVQAIQSGAMTVRVPTRQRGDELDELSVLFNGMLDKISQLLQAMRGALDNVAHDLRTPVTRLRGIAELALRSDQDAAGSHAALADCVEESDHLLRMLNALMDISEAQAGALKLNLERVNVALLLEDTVDLYQHVAEEKDLRLSAAARQNLWLMADRVRLRQAVANLLDNATKYTPQGGQVELNARAENGSVMITVTDTGTGINPDDLPKVWDRLYRADQSRSERGLGLGLSLVKAVVEAHKGHVEAESRPGSGSTFRIVLPLTE